MKSDGSQNEAGSKNSPQAEAPTTKDRPSSSTVFHFDRLKAEREARKEFKDWKRTLSRIIERESRLEFQPDGSHVFVLPKKIVELVYKVMIKERMKIEQRANEQATEEELVAKATAGLKEDLEKGSAEVKRLALEQASKRREEDIARRTKGVKLTATDDGEAVTP